MFEDYENYANLIVIFCHKFDDATGLYVHTAMVCVCCEETMVTILEATYADMRHPNYLLETVAFEELSRTDRREIVEQLLRPCFGDQFIGSAPKGKAYYPPTYG